MGGSWKEMREKLAQASLDLYEKESDNALGVSLLGGHDGGGVVEEEVADSQMIQMEGQLSQLEISQEVSSGDPSRFLNGTMRVHMCVCVIPDRLPTGWTCTCVC